MNITRIEREEELFRLWQSLPAPGSLFRSSREERIVLIAHGTLNDGPGPDFRDAVLLIDGRLCVGDVEMHLRESDWFAHGHEKDSAYDAVVLHVLAEERTSSGGVLKIPTVSARRLAEVASAIGDEKTGIDGPERSEDRRSLNLLAELSWERLLRRGTEILRDGKEEGTDDRIARAFLLRLFDSLGYSRNREPMKEVAEWILANRARFPGIGFDETAGMIFAGAGVSAERLRKVGRAFMSEERLRLLLPPAELQGEAPRWDYRGRPANAPERRLWGGAKLTFDHFHRRLLEDALGSVRRKAAFTSLLSPFIVRLGGETILGRSRAEEIVVNVLCPVALAAGILRREIDLIQGACLTYRNAPSLASNRIVREVERRFGIENLDGGFLQQGAIEYYQRILSPDREGYSMIAEPEMSRRGDEGERRKGV